MPRHHDPEELLDAIRLPDGHVLTVRSAGPGDEDALGALYDSLDVDDRAHRFFTSYRPSRRRLEEWVRAEVRGAGHRLIARLDDGDAVGDAGYFLLHDGSGDAEFDLTVADEHRGWLGPYLLDRLVAVAAAKGVRNLQADILFENRQMLAVVRKRGYVTIPNDDLSVIHVVIGAESTTPTWPEDHTRLRMLVESRSGNWHGARLAAEQGVELRVCPGPRSTRSWRCPVLDGRPCPVVADADAVVFALPLDDPDAATVLAEHRRLHPGTVLCVEPRWCGDEQPLDLPHAARRVDPNDPDEVTAIVEATRP